MRDVCVEEWREKKEKKNLGIWCVEVTHGRATTDTGRAKVLDFEGFARHGVARPCQCRHRSCQASSSLAQIFFLRFLESCLDNYLQNNLKQTKTNKKRLNAWVASHEALV